MYRINEKNKMDGLLLLSELDNNRTKAIFFDPQYRGILDKLSYGNEGKNRGKKRSALPQMTENIIKSFLIEIERVLVPSGYLFLWVDKFHLCEGISSWFKQNSEMEVVDLITWNKLKMGMGYRTRRKSEYLFVIQKAPKLAKATWTVHNIPDVWEEKVNKNHPHSKPIELQKALIEAVTNEGELIVDPAAGGYSVLEACLQTNRLFIGCDIETEED